MSRVIDNVKATTQPYLTQNIPTGGQKVHNVLNGAGEVRFYDALLGTTWYVYFESHGFKGVVRAKNQEHAWECCVNEILDDWCEVEQQEWLNHQQEWYGLNTARYVLPEGVHRRSEGIPLNLDLQSEYAEDDLHGWYIERMTLAHIAVYNLKFLVEDC